LFCLFALFVRLITARAGTLSVLERSAAMPTHHSLPLVPSFPTDQRALDAPHRKMLAPLADLLVVATEAAHAANDAPTVARLDQAWLLVVAAVVDTHGGVA
jgi:hypothetical protein